MNLRLHLSFFALILLLSACGGGGSSAPATHVTGTASKGVIKQGTIRIYVLEPDGSRGRLLCETLSDENGAYEADIGGYDGPILGVAFGSYVDEADPTTVITLTEANALRAALPRATGNVTLPITGLTELAVREAGALTPDAITAANHRISSFFEVDILATRPVEASSAALNASGVTTAQRDYTLALAALSQLAAASGPGSPAQRLDRALNNLLEGIGTTTGTPAAESVSSAVASYLDGNRAINAVITSNGGTRLSALGGTARQLVVKLSGTGSRIYGIELTLTLPAGMTVAAHPDGTVYPGVIGIDSDLEAFPIGNYAPAEDGSGTLTLVLASGSDPIRNSSSLVVNAAMREGMEIRKEVVTLTRTVFRDQDGNDLTGVEARVEVK